MDYVAIPTPEQVLATRLEDTMFLDDKKLNVWEKKKYRDAQNVYNAAIAYDPDCPMTGACSDFRQESFFIRNQTDFCGYIQGPYNSFTYDFYPIVACGRTAGKVKVSDDSINCIRVDESPEDVHDRMMVAASVALNSLGNAMRPRGTTILPNIRGLPHVLALIFAPFAEFQTDKTNLRMVAARCGLGRFEIGEDSSDPLFPDHDMEFVFDTEFTAEDVRRINNIRFMVFDALDGDIRAETLNRTRSLTLDHQRKARDLLLEVITRKRQIVPKCQEVKWRNWDQTDGLSLRIPLDFDTRELEFKGFRALRAISNE
jgi:hypothetical protein